ncbi:MAG: hypothetical protein D6675_10605 [Gemmatimonadetes bacterium]|nr:MAG: hypothetical protein D6675_10605 [Gemmatimonadota bacterium]
MSKEGPFYTSFVTLDLETTGLDPQRERIIEVGAVRYVEGRYADRYYALINPEREIPLFITKLTGITQAQVRDKPKIDEILPHLIEFVGDNDPIVIQNASFDLGFLKANGYYPPNLILDTLPLARSILPHLPNHKQGTIAAYFGIETQHAHRAYDDAQVLAEIYLKLLDELDQLDRKELERLLSVLNHSDEGLRYLIVEKHREAVLKPAPLGKTSKLAGKMKFPPNQYGTQVALDREQEDTPVKPLDPVEIAKMFQQHGVFAQKFPKYEVRKPQIEMARAVAETFNEGTISLIEAGTGTGKSMAYLIPAVLWAVQNNQRVVISTNTKNLQDQLFYKDIPLVQRVLDVDFRAVLLKGRSNYLCPFKWEHAMYVDDGRLTDYEKSAILPIVLWSQYTQTGDINENNGFNLSRNRGLWAKLCSDSFYCTHKDECHKTDKCWVTKARRAAQEAHIVVINHSLLFSDLATEHGILGKYNYIVFDEAHNLEAVATSYLGYELNPWEVKNLLNYLYQKDRTDFGLLTDVRRMLAKSTLRRSIQRQLSERNEKIIEEINQVHKAANSFFRALSTFMSKLSDRDDYPLKKLRYAAGHHLLKAASTPFMDFMDEIDTLKNDLDSFAVVLSDISVQDLPGVDDLSEELKSKVVDLELLQNKTSILMEGYDPQYVYWAEAPKKEGSDDVRLLAAPIDISNAINTLLYDHMHAIVMTSATLQVNGKFDFMRERLGLKESDQAERVTTYNIGSPFNFDKQVQVCALSYFPSPKQFEEYTAATIDFIKRVTRYARRGALALFTSYSMLHQVYENIKEELEESDILVLGQGIDGNPSQVLNEFKMVNESILLGTDSFWEGVDVPGESLQLLYLTKLPFALPSEPIIQARTEAIERQGRNSFMEYAVPLAVIRFRQGFGRVIRTKNDKGIVFIMDNRVLQTRYGREFLNSLPVRHREFRTARQIGEEIKQWLTVY